MRREGEGRRGGGREREGGEEGEGEGGVRVRDRDKKTFLQHCTYYTEEATTHLFFDFGNDRYRQAHPLCSSDTPDTMNIVLFVIWQCHIDHIGDTCDVDAASSYVSADEKSGRAILCILREGGGREGGSEEGKGR